MAWKIEFLREAERDLAKLGSEEIRRILKFLNTRIASLEDPRLVGEALHGPVLGKYWKYRVGQHRIIADIRDDAVRVIVVRVGHRREVYR
ncbi:type II toxin-antitoxin system RelE/ParE family toxin [Neorhizobium lilium]|uniref:Type II toxin-antitoxin system RelE/ParE family toxin n=1 Tax=Neorhizobium lilium TaxID=2503024 RepID=A0A3S3S3V0_9HYPH|nr:type II toxin-antitoxin system RelE/ParE family toxin [Neorhizobium lilium]RWX76032.1 type II toxin-antitoxin system RelE/ParE family toxin [Neorhizobium lilium]